MFQDAPFPRFVVLAGTLSKIPRCRGEALPFLPPFYILLTGATSRFPQVGSCVLTSLGGSFSTWFFLAPSSSSLDGYIFFPPCLERVLYISLLPFPGAHVCSAPDDSYAFFSPPLDQTHVFKVACAGFSCRCGSHE